MGVPESFPYIMALTIPLLLLVATLSSANTGVEYDYHEEDQPTQSSEPVQIENLVRQTVPSRIYSSSWSNNIPGTLGFGKRSRIPLFLVKTDSHLARACPLVIQGERVRVRLVV